MSKELSDLLRRLRGDEPLRDVAKRAEVSHTYLSQLEAGIDKRTGKEIRPSAETLQKIAKAYNYPYEKLLEVVGYIDTVKETKQDKELRRFIEQAGVMFDGVPITDDDREKLRKALEFVFWDAKKQNKRKKS